MKNENVNLYWQYVQEKYPDAKFDFWYRHGELHFYPDGNSEEIHACFKHNGEYVIKAGF